MAIFIGNTNILGATDESLFHYAHSVIDKAEISHMNKELDGRYEAAKRQVVRGSFTCGLGAYQENVELARWMREYNA